MLCQINIFLFLSLIPFTQDGDSCFSPISWCLFTWPKVSTIISAKPCRVEGCKLTSLTSCTGVKRIRGVQSQLTWRCPKHQSVVFKRQLNPLLSSPLPFSLTWTTQQSPDVHLPALLSLSVTTPLPWEARQGLTRGQWRTPAWHWRLWVMGPGLCLVSSLSCAPPHLTPRGDGSTCFLDTSPPSHWPLLEYSAPRLSD